MSCRYAARCARAAVVCYVRETLLGGPQARVPVGDSEAIAACRRRPLPSAAHIDRLRPATLDPTRGLYRDHDHARRMLQVPALLAAGEAALEAAIG